MTAPSAAPQAGPMKARNPRTGEFDFEFPAASAQEIHDACAGLRRAQTVWEKMGVERRGAVLERWAAAILEHAAAIGEAEAKDTGRWRVSHEVPAMVAASIRDWARRAPGMLRSVEVSDVPAAMPGTHYRTQLVPYPLVGVISPWNHPFLMSLVDAVPALLAGCAVIVKPSEITPRFVGPVMETIGAVPELAAILTYVRGAAEAGQALIDNVDALAFTGSIATGRKVAEACGRRLIPAFLELGGKDPAIVTPSADLERAADAVFRGAVHNTGQVCYATERVYVSDAIHDAFVEALKRRAAEMECNFPDMRRGHLGPFILPSQADIVDEHIDDALARGANMVFGAKSLTRGGGRYMGPVLLTDVTHEMKVMQDETFGPVIPVMRYAVESEAVTLANDTIYGLSAAVFSGIPQEADRIAAQINAGCVSINDTGLNVAILRDAGKTSFGQSGAGGSRTGADGLLRFLRKKALVTSAGPVTAMSALGEHA